MKEKHIKSKIFFEKDCIVDEWKVLGFAKIKNGEGYNSVNINVEFLEKTLKILKELSLDYITISVAENQPILFRTNRKSKMCLTIAPRIENDS